MTTITKSEKSVRYDVELSKRYTGERMHNIIEAAAIDLNLVISHIGGYSRVKYPNSIHWHFKEDLKEKGCLDATFWEEGNEFWIVSRNREPLWVRDKAIALQQYLNKRL